MATYTCSGCGYTTGRPSASCPQCGAITSGIKCRKCGHVDTESAFAKNGCCPKCGSRGTTFTELAKKKKRRVRWWKFW